MTTASASPQQAEPTTAAAVASPPTSPPAKRVKTDNAASSSLPIMSSAAATNGTSSAAAAVTTLDQAPPLLIKKLSDKGRLPTRGSAFAAGYDIYAARETVIPARGKALVDTDISMAVPAGTCTLCPRVPFPSLSLATVLFLCQPRPTSNISIKTGPQSS